MPCLNSFLAHPPRLASWPQRSEISNNEDSQYSYNKRDFCIGGIMPASWAPERYEMRLLCKKPVMLMPDHHAPEPLPLMLRPLRPAPRAAQSLWGICFVLPVLCRAKALLFKALECKPVRQKTPCTKPQALLCPSPRCRARCNAGRLCCFPASSVVTCKDPVSALVFARSVVRAPGQNVHCDSSLKIVIKLRTPSKMFSSGPWPGVHLA